MDETCRRCGGCPDVRCTSPWPMQMQIAPAGFLEDCSRRVLFRGVDGVMVHPLRRAVQRYASARRTPHYMSLYPTFELDFREL
jgi:hypothetical protein